ncbi:MAG TPA: phage tail protein [Solirubrobacteraceae bacterium]
MSAQPRVALEHAFQVSVGGQLLGAFQEVTGLGLEYETYEYAEGGNNLFVHTLLGRAKYPRLTLRSGLTDRSVLLAWTTRSGSLTGPQDLRIIFVDATQRPLKRYGFVQAIPVRWTGPNANIAGNAVATESLEIAHQGLTPGVR